MELLFRRGQSDDSWGRPKFDLWAKFEITDEEQHLISKYRVRNAILAEGDPRRDFYRALRYSVLATVGIIAFGTAIKMNVNLVIFLALCALIGGTVVIYQQIREEI